MELAPARPIAIMNEIIQSAKTLPVLELASWSILINVAIFVGSLVFGYLIIAMSKHRPRTPSDPLRPLEWILAGVCVLLNSLVFFSGAMLWRAGIINGVLEVSVLKVLQDVIVLFLVMDCFMYFSHRLAHHRWFYPWAHQTHHIFQHPRPLTLYALHPLEVVGFGSLWLIVISIYDASWVGMVIYLGFNVLFGMIGHLGAEVYPQNWLRFPVLRYVSTNTFHVGHHADIHSNFGFYTLIWDRLFGTVSTSYSTNYQSATNVNSDSHCEEPTDAV